MSDDLPFVDEHDVTITADVERVWSVLLDTLDRALSRPAAAAYARAVGCVPRVSSGARPMGEGATVPGFRVVSADPGRALAMEGRHRFSAYRLAFRLAAEEHPVACVRLTAESSASFAGVLGAAYRVLVVRTGGHVVGVRGLLSGIKRRSETAR